MSERPKSQPFDLEHARPVVDTPGSIWRLLRWPSLVLFTLVPLLGLAHWYLQLDLDNFSLAILDQRFVMLSAAFHGLALALSISAWHINLKKHRIQQLSLLQSAAMTGLSALGKYTPGKVWGLLARGLAVQRLSGSTQTAAASALTEQVALLHSAAGLALLCLLATLDQGFSLMAGAMLLLIVSVPLLAGSSTLLWPLLQRLSPRGQLSALNPNQEIKGAYPIVFTGLFLMWMAASAVLWASVRAYGAATAPDFADATLITLLAYFGGFASVFAPAGLGVRDGIMAAMLAPFTGVAPAICIALLHRLITAGFDLLLGILALFAIAKRPPRREV